MKYVKVDVADILDYFKPLQVEVRDSFEDAVRRFKSEVQKEKILNTLKEKRHYEKPSVLKKRKRRESEKRRFISELREKQILSGEWERIQKRKEKKKLQKIQEKKQKSNFILAENFTNE